jgi:hypothetical protein
VRIHRLEDNLLSYDPKLLSYINKTCKINIINLLLTLVTKDVLRDLVDYRVSTKELYTFLYKAIIVWRSLTEATRLRFNQEKSRLHLIRGESSSHRGRTGGRSAITN